MHRIVPLIVLAGLISAQDMLLEHNDPAGVLRFEIALPHAMADKVSDSKYKWTTPATLVVTVAGDGKQPTAWIVGQDRPQLTRLHVDDRSLTWQPPRLTGDVSYSGILNGSKIRWTLDLSVNGSDITGTCQAKHTRASKGKKAELSYEGPANGKVLRREDLEVQAIGSGRAWPGWRGGAHAGVATAESADVTMVDDLADARLLWKTDTPTPMPGHTDDKLLGGYGEITVAEDRVFMNWYIGHGDVYPDGKTFEQTVVAIQEKMEKSRGLKYYINDYFKGSVEEYVRAKMSIAATDVIDCYDARTGATLWRARFPGKGLNWKNCDGPHFHPTYEDGRITFVGSAGAIFCLEAVSGKLLWESSLPGRPAAAEWVKQATASKGNPVRHGDARHLINKPMSIDGVVVVAEAGLYGLDGKTGKQLWGPIKEVSNGNPRPWKHGDKTYVLCRTHYGRGAGGGGLVCVDPKTGELLWHDKRLPGGSKEYANDGTYLFSSGIGVGKDGKKGSTIYEPTCFKLTPSGLEKLWSLPQITEAPRMAGPVLYQGYVYTIWDGVWEEGAKKQSFIVCIEAATGKVIGKVPLSNPGIHAMKTWQGLVAGNGRLFYINGQSGPKNILMRTGPDFGAFKDFATLNSRESWKIPGTYQVLSPALCDGRLFLREKGEAGAGGSRIYCYDLRKQP